MATESTSLSSLYDRYRLGAIFSKEVYSADKSLGRVAIHFFVALGNSAQHIESYLKKLGPEKSKEAINRGHSESFVTALHLAVMKSREDVVRLLVQWGGDVNAKDRYNMTPWHHTALLVDYAAIKELVKTGKEEPSWHMLRRRSGLEKDGNLPQNIYVREGGQDRPLSLSTLQTDVGVDEYLNNPLFSPELHDELWKRSDVLNWTNLPLSKNTFYINLKALPDDNNQRGFYAKDLAPQGTLLGQYTGCVEKAASSRFMNKTLGQWAQIFEKQVLGLEEVDEYSFFLNDTLSVSPLTKGNIFRLLNDGWPNVSLSVFPGASIGAMTIVDVLPDTELTFDYGISRPTLKWGNYYLTQKAEIEEYFQSHRLLDIAHSIVKNVNILDFYEKQKHILLKNILAEKKSPEFTQHLALIASFKRVQYLFNTPSAIVYLCTKRIINPTDLLEILKIPQWRELLQVRTNFFHFTWIIGILCGIEEGLENTSRLPVDLQNQIQKRVDFFLNHIFDKFPVPKMLAALYALLSDIEQMLGSQSLQYSEDQLKNFAEKYQWQFKDGSFFQWDYKTGGYGLYNPKAMQLAKQLVLAPLGVK